MDQSVEVALISRDKDVRLAAARAFDAAPSSWTVRLHESAPESADVLVFGPDVKEEAEGGFVFDPDAPASIIDRVRDELARPNGRTYVVTGAGGGAGTTAVALHLAQVAATHHRTCYLDADPRWSSAPRLGINGEHLTWGDQTPGAKDENASSSAGAALPVAGGFRALLSPTSFEPKALLHVLDSACDDFDRVVVDCPASESLSLALERADAGILVVPHSAPGARRAATILSAYDGVRWAVVLNRAGPGGELTRAAVHRILGCKTALQLPCTPSLRDAEDEGKLLSSSWSRYLRSIQRLFDALETHKGSPGAA